VLSNAFGVRQLQSSPISPEIGTTEILAWFKKVSGTVAGTARRVLRTTVPDTFLNHAEILFAFQ
jgi:hypothetical protein